MYAGYPVKIYINGIFINTATGVCITCDLYPKGLWVLAQPNENQVIFWWKTNTPNELFSYNWSDIKFF